MSAVERAAALRSEANAAVPAALLALLRSVKRIWVVPHERPDGDALGAALGLQGILAQSGVEVAVLCSEAPPKVYEVIPTLARVLLSPPDWAPDAVILVDCGDTKRAGSVGALVQGLPSSVQRATIDHHVSNTSASPLEWIDPKAAATCEMVALIGVALEADLSVDGGVGENAVDLDHRCGTVGILAVRAAGSVWLSVGNIARLGGMHGITRAFVIVKCQKRFTRAQCASIRCAKECADDSLPISWL